MVLTWMVLCACGTDGDGSNGPDYENGDGGGETHNPSDAAPSAADLQDLGSLLVDDLDDLVSIEASIGDSVPAADATGETCFDGLGTCRHCVDWKGDFSSGTFSSALESAPCGATGSAGGLSWEWALESNDVGGTYASEDGITHALHMSGSRNATWSWELGALSGTDDASWDLASLDLDVTEGIAGDYALALTWENYREHTWAFDLARTKGEVAGTATRDGELVCDVSGTATSLVIVCK